MKTNCVVLARTMKTIRLITLATLIGAFMATTAWPQGITCWRIVNGPGAGIVITGSDLTIFDSYYFADGSIAFGHFPDCQCTGFDGHYHGVLFTNNDPNPNGCGWGCVKKVPCSPQEAADGLHDAIEFIGNTIDENLGFKLDEIFHTMEGAAADGEYGVVDKLADAFSNEIHAYFLKHGFNALFNPTIRSLTEYVDSALDAISPPAFIPTIPSATVKLLYQIGSGPRGIALDPGSKVTVPVGEVIHFQAFTDPGVVNPIFRWNYLWKGGKQGDLPDGVGTAFRGNGITILSEIPTSVKLNVQLMTPTGKPPQDSITVNYVESIW